MIIEKNELKIYKFVFNFKKLIFTIPLELFYKEIIK